jgi:4,5-dihydroxyphthalate decarboxylase
VRLKIAFSRNLRVEPLIDGTVPIDGVEPEWMSGNSPGELHLHHLTHDDCDVFEFSLSNYLILCGKALPPRQQWIGIPIFLSKTLHLAGLYARADAGITSLSDLRGKRVAVPDYHMTAAIWIRIILRELYGVLPQEIRWFNGRTAGESHGEGATATLDPSISLTRLEEAGATSAMLQRGELDVSLSGTGFGVNASESVRLLLGESGARQVLAELYASKGVTPANHVLLIQRRLVEDDPALPMRLYAAFEQSKREAYRRARRAAGGYLLFPGDDFARQQEAFGEDPFPCGLGANQAMLTMLLDEEMREGLVPRPLDVDGLFAESTRAT